MSSSPGTKRALSQQAEAFIQWRREETEQFHCSETILSPLLEHWQSQGFLTAGFPGKLGFTKCTTSVAAPRRPSVGPAGVGGRSRGQGCASLRSASRPRGLPPSRRRNRPWTAQEEGSGSPVPPPGRLSPVPASSRAATAASGGSHAACPRQGVSPALTLEGKRLGRRD